MKAKIIEQLHCPNPDCVSNHSAALANVVMSSYGDWYRCNHCQKKYRIRTVEVGEILNEGFTIRDGGPPDECWAAWAESRLDALGAAKAYRTKAGSATPSDFPKLEIPELALARGLHQQDDLYWQELITEGLVDKWTKQQLFYAVRRSVRAELSKVISEVEVYPRTSSPDSSLVMPNPSQWRRLLSALGLGGVP